ncbi:hypothetical protein ACWDUL_33795 [Nocardia niigatensis]
METAVAGTATPTRQLWIIGRRLVFGAHYPRLLADRPDERH